MHDCWVCGINFLNFEQPSTWNWQAVVIFSPGLHIPPFDQGSTSQKPLSTGSIRTNILDAAFIYSVKRKKSIFPLQEKRKGRIRAWIFDVVKDLQGIYYQAESFSKQLLLSSSWIYTEFSKNIRHIIKKGNTAKL